MRSMAQDAFGRALSLAVPNTSVPCSSLFELAVDVVRRGRFDAGEARRLLAMDASADPFREAMDELEEALNRTIRSGRDRQAVWDLCTRVAGAARDSVSAPQRDMESYSTRSSATTTSQATPSTFGQNPGGAGGDWPDGPDPLSVAARKIPTGPGPTVDRRQAADAGSSELDAIFREFPAPLRL
jgi:hypothetical protein